MGREIKSITIGLAVDEVQEVARWHQTLLGEVEMIEPSPGAIELKLCNNVWLQLDDTGYLEVGGKSSVLRLETDNIESTYKTVKDLAGEVDEIEEVEGGLKYLDFKDP